MNKNIQIKKRFFSSLDVEQKGILKDIVIYGKFSRLRYLPNDIFDPYGFLEDIKKWIDNGR